MKTWHVVAGAGAGVAALAVLFWPKQAAPPAAALSWKNTGPMTIKPKAGSPIALTYKGAGDLLTGTDPDALVVTTPDRVFDYAGTPILDLDDPNAVPLY
jgi:hypothetical protein